MIPVSVSSLGALKSIDAFLGPARTRRPNVATPEVRCRRIPRGAAVRSRFARPA